MYGLCFQEDAVCSYSENISQNRTLAICCFVFGTIGIVTSCIGVYLIRKYGYVFGIASGFGGPHGFVGRSIGSNYTNGSDVENHLRQQNEILQQQLELQRQNQQQYGPFTPPLESNCYTNLAFIPPELPPYSPTDATVEGSTISPYDPPPPYSIKDTSQK